MAVSPRYQGKHIGYLLGKTVMEYARQNEIKRIFLEGNTHLTASIALYRKLDFEEIYYAGLQCFTKSMANIENRKK